MRSRSRFTFAAVALLSILVIGTGLAWACTGPEGGVDDSSGSPGDQTTFNGRYFKADESVEVRWNRANENSPDAPLMTTAQADANGLLTFTVTIPEAEPGSYWIVVLGVGDDWADGGSRLRAQVDYTIEGAPPAQEPPSQAPPGQEPEQSADPRPDRTSKDPQARSTDRPPARSHGDSVGFTRTDTGAPATALLSDDAAVVDRNRDGRDNRGNVVADEIPAAAYRHDPAMTTTSTWSGASSVAGNGPAPSLVPTDAADDAGSPLSQLVLGVTILGAGLVLMLAGFFVADIRRQRTAEAEVEQESTHQRS